MGNAVTIGVVNHLDNSNIGGVATYQPNDTDKFGHINAGAYVSHEKSYVILFACIKFYALSRGTKHNN